MRAPMQVHRKHFIFILQINSLKIYIIYQVEYNILVYRK